MQTIMSAPCGRGAADTAEPNYAWSKVAHLRSIRTHQGELWGNPPTGHTLNIEEVHILRLADGKFEHWGVVDPGALVQQLGITPPS